MAAGLTPRMRDTILVIQELTDIGDGRAPSYSEIASALGLRSKAMVAERVACLAERGWITFTPGHARSLALVRRIEPEELEFVGTFAPSPEQAAVLARMAAELQVPA